MIRKSGSVTFPTNPHLPYCLALLGCLPDSSNIRGGPEVTAWSPLTRTRTLAGGAGRVYSSRAWGEPRPRVFGGCHATNRVYNQVVAPWGKIRVGRSTRIQEPTSRGPLLPQAPLGRRFAVVHLWDVPVAVNVIADGHRGALQPTMFVESSLLAILVKGYRCFQRCQMN